MRSGGRSSGGVSEQGRRIDQTPKREAADGPCVASMTSLNLLERTNELSDGLIRPFKATREGRRGSISEIPAKTRYRVISDGGMLYQFLGDSVVGLFGVPEGASGYLAHAVECACGLVDIGASVATEWQRQIDEIQPAAGVHVSMALGDLQVLSLRPLSRTGGRRRLHQPRRASQPRRGLRRDRREQHALPAPARRRPCRVPGTAACRGKERRPGPRLEGDAEAVFLNGGRPWQKH